MQDFNTFMDDLINFIATYGTYFLWLVALMLSNYIIMGIVVIYVLYRIIKWIMQYRAQKKEEEEKALKQMEKEELRKELVHCREENKKLRENLREKAFHKHKWWQFWKR